MVVGHVEGCWIDTMWYIWWLAKAIFAATDLQLHWVSTVPIQCQYVRTAVGEPEEYAHKIMPAGHFPWLNDEYGRRRIKLWHLAVTFSSHRWTSHLHNQNDTGILWQPVMLGPCMIHHIYTTKMLQNLKYTIAKTSEASTGMQYGICVKISSHILQLGDWSSRSES